MVGTHLQGGVVGGFEIDGKARATGINSVTGAADGADINAADTLPAYFKSIMNIVGIAPDRQAIRLPTGVAVSSLLRRPG